MCGGKNDRGQDCAVHSAADINQTGYGAEITKDAGTTSQGSATNRYTYGVQRAGAHRTKLLAAVDTIHRQTTDLAVSNDTLLLQLITLNPVTRLSVDG